MPATVRMLCTTALKTTFDVLLPQFERSAGHKVEPSYGPSAQLLKRLEGGEASDAAILTGPGIEQLTRQGKMVAGSRVDIAHSAIMVAVKKGTPRPDISSVEKFKAAMLAAKSIAMSNPVGGGTSGAHLAKVFEQLGIADALKGKMIYGPGGPAGLIGNYLVRGEAEIGIQQESELMAVPGVDIVGPLPAEIQSVSVFALGKMATGGNGDAVKALGQLLRTPAALAVLKDKGLTPA